MNSNLSNNNNQNSQSSSNQPNGDFPGDISINPRTTLETRNIQSIDSANLNLNTKPPIARSSYYPTPPSAGNYTNLGDQVESDYYNQNTKEPDTKFISEPDTPPISMDNRIDGGFSNNSFELEESNLNTENSPNYNQNLEGFKLEETGDYDPTKKQKNKKSFFSFLVLITTVAVVAALAGGVAGFYVANDGSFDINKLDSENNTASLKNSTTKIVEQTSTVKKVDEQSEIINVVTKNEKSVVSVAINQNSKIDSQQLSQQVGAGTGFVVSKEGYIITNRHVVSTKNANYSVIFKDGTRVEAEVLGRDQVLDIAVLKIPANDSLKPVSIGTSKDIKVGQTVIAIGNSLGEFNNTVSKGIVSGLERNIRAADTTGENSELLEGVIQTDASINPGNSGGPLFDIEGNVVGVNVAKAEDGENIGFSIPIDMVKPVLNSVRDTGSIQRPYIGIRYVSLNPEFSAANDLSVDYGAWLVNDEESPVVKGGPADKAGIKEGDILLEVDGKKIESNNSLISILGEYSVGDKIKIKILRDSKEIEITLVLEVFPDAS